MFKVAVYNRIELWKAKKSDDVRSWLMFFSPFLCKLKYSSSSIFYSFQFITTTLLHLLLQTTQNAKTRHIQCISSLENNLKMPIHCKLSRSSFERRNRIVYICLKEDPIIYSALSWHSITIKGDIDEIYIHKCLSLVF